MKKLINIIILICSTHILIAQGTFHKIYGTMGQNWAAGVRQTSDSGYILAGTGHGFSFNQGNFLVKTDANGDTLWTKLISSNYFENTLHIEVSDDGGYIFCGSSEYVMPVGSRDILLIKTDATGNVTWNKRYSLSGLNMGNSVCNTSDGGYIIAGQQNIIGNSYIAIIKTDLNGDIEWSKLIGDSSHTISVSIVQTADSGYVFTGAVENSGIDRVFLCKLAQDGDILWFKTYYENFPGMAAYGNVVQQTPDGGYILLANRDSMGIHYTWLLKTDTAGTLLWNKVYSGSYKNIANGMCLTSDSGYAIAFTNVNTLLNADISVLKTDSSGNVSWCKVYGDTTDEQASDIRQTTDGGFIIAGRKYSQNSDFDMYLIKTDAAGNSGCMESNFSPGVISPNTSESLESPFYITGYTTTSFSPATEDGSIFSTLCSTTGIMEPNDENWGLIYPNPTSGKFTIQFDYSELTVINSIGEIIFYKPRGYKTQEIDLSLNPPGIYFCKLALENGNIHNLKLILQ